MIVPSLIMIAALYLGSDDRIWDVRPSKDNIVFKREGLITPKNRLSGVFVLVLMGLEVTAFTDLPEVVVFGVVMVAASSPPTDS